MHLLSLSLNFLRQSTTVRLQRQHLPAEPMLKTGQFSIKSVKFPSRLHQTANTHFKPLRIAAVMKDETEEIEQNLRGQCAR